MQDQQEGKTRDTTQQETDGKNEFYWISFLSDYIAAEISGQPDENILSPEHAVLPKFVGVWYAALWKCFTANSVSNM